MTTPERYEDTPDPKKPPNSLLRPLLRPQMDSALLMWLLGGLAAVFGVVSVVALFWMAVHPRTMTESQLGSAEIYQPGEPGAFEFSLAGGHDPVPRPRNTEAELKFRGFDLGAGYAADSNR